ncbi:MAG: hypothetical protein JSR96_14725 [Proteobacteria bacterium]|nr:hypothetical protein [Pseudomonadota bacterium]
MLPDQVLTTLPTEQRLALSYAPAASQGRLAALFALDARLASVVRSASEPMLAQIRLAWWRDRLKGLAAAEAPAEPLLQFIAQADVSADALIPLCDGWEMLATADSGTAVSALAGLADGRASAVAALADAEHRQEAQRAGQGWALADLAARLSNPAERNAAIALAAAQDWRRPALPRSLRPIAVLHALARRRHDGRPLLSGGGAIPLAMRVGLLGI